MDDAVRLSSLAPVVVTDIASISAHLPPAPAQILILGGTQQAASCAAFLVNAGYDVTTSLAGRTREPKPVSGQVRIGSFGGAEGLATWLIEQAIDVLIDATHPFAKQISANAVAAATISKRKLIVFERQPWQRLPGDNWIEVASLSEARDQLPKGASVLLALGSQHIAEFAKRNDVHFLIRMVDPPEARAFPFSNFTLLIGKPGDVRFETKILITHKITHIVCRNSGGSAAYAKIEAARNLRLPVIMVSR
jgi:precorrin-6A/cobalt-precorrin-6A reductase